jgi:hypothetical protein
MIELKKTYEILCLKRAHINPLLTLRYFLLDNNKRQERKVIFSCLIDEHPLLLKDKLSTRVANARYTKKFIAFLPPNSFVD